MAGSLHPVAEPASEFEVALAGEVVRSAAHRDSVSRITTTKNGRVITASDDGSIRVWDPATSRQLSELQHEYWVRDIAVSPDGSKLASSALDDTVRLWDLDTGQEIYRLPGHGRQGGTRAVGFSADGQSFGSFGDDCYLRMWDVRTGKALLEHQIGPPVRSRRGRRTGRAGLLSY
jgi:WD40 repeat protein